MQSVRFTDKQQDELVRLESRIEALGLILTYNPGYLERYVDANENLAKKRREILAGHDLDLEDVHVVFDTSCGHVLFEGIN